MEQMENDRQTGRFQSISCREGFRRKVRKGLNIVIILLVILIMLLLSILFVFRQMGLTVCTVQGMSMTPTVADGTKLLLNPEKDVERFDIVVFKDDNQYIIKRMIGLPGDTVTVMDGNLFVNGELYHEPYLDEAHCEKFDQTDFKVVVPEGEYFVLGDNRDGSFDSRDAGMIEEDQMVGVAILML